MTNNWQRIMIKKHLFTEIIELSFHLVEHFHDMLFGHVSHYILFLTGSERNSLCF